MGAKQSGTSLAWSVIKSVLGPCRVKRPRLKPGFNLIIFSGDVLFFALYFTSSCLVFSTGYLVIRGGYRPIWTDRIGVRKPIMHKIVFKVNIFFDHLYHMQIL